jgi:hypothetical protein
MTMTIKNPIATGVSLIVLGIFLLITSHAHGQTTNGLTTAQKAQVADPKNPQFEPIPQYQFPDADKNAPDEATKTWALKRAYQLNGNSMVGNNRTIDLSKETPFSTVVKTERILPVARPDTKNELDEQADLNMDDLRTFSRRANMKTDICARYHKRRVMIDGGKSWRCK